MHAPNFMKKFVFGTALTALVAGCATNRPAAVPPQTPPPAPVVFALQNGIDSFSYALGLSIAKSLQQDGITNVNEAAAARAMRAVFQKDSLLLTDEQMATTLREKLQQFAAEKVNAQKAAGEKFFAENKSKPGVVALPSGMQYRIITQGSGPMPKLNDQVRVHYTGRLVNGEIFDSSVKRGEPATFGLTGVIKGWTDILQMMPKGSKWEVFIPSDLAYGDAGRGSTIPGGAPLIFEMELLDILPAQ